MIVPICVCNSFADCGSHAYLLYEELDLLPFTLKGDDILQSLKMRHELPLPLPPALQEENKM